MPIHQATHPHFDDHKKDWTTVRRMMTGEKVAAELIQRYFEHRDHFDQRQKDADFTPRTRFLLGRLAGMLFERAGDVQRDEGPIEEGSLEQAGPKGEDYRVLLLRLAQTLLSHNEAVVVLNPATGLHVQTPLTRPHWTGQEATIQGSRVEASSVMEDGTRVRTWTRYMPSGFEVYRKSVSNEDEAELIGSGTWAGDARPGGEAPFFVDDEGRPTAPVLRVEMSWEAQVGLQIAKKHRSIFRMTSRRDFALSAAMNGLIQLGVGDNESLADEIEHRLKSGLKVVPYDSDYGPHQGLEMPTAGVEAGSSVLKGKKKELNRIAYNELEEGARTSGSATEAQIKHQGGAASALSVLAETMADAEQRILRLKAQAENFREYAGPQPSPPGVSVEWPTDYSDVVGPSEDDLARRIFGSQLPADEETATEVLMDVFREEGYEPGEDALEEEVRSALDRSAQASSTTGQFLQ
ncbi:hypothetical protein [Salinibacter altiplanensis]|uniref:hypothetical protein n=1 Tax=Salinibacter altiplanensis TaxID=1803181 RepID=UPI000C9F9A9A|nr:hypothetical protein [Salinibacter altiplanensis]